ncbi:hypothetical protein FQA39_LY16040 [Lamprigera yunnana]|nr:hypothetical protein FQA39_LY16040 [Lamprigera yunnana]
MWFILLFACLVVIVYNYVIKPMSYWKNRLVAYEKPLPLFGNMLSVILGKNNSTELYQKIYENHPNERYIGMFSFTTPVLIVKDPELLKTVMVKEFDTFPEHRRMLSENADPLWTQSIFAIKGGEKWRKLRSILSPFFNSTKLRSMFVLMRECAKRFSKHFLEQSDLVEVELKDSLTRFANDVLAITAYGYNCDSLSDPNNEFYIMAKNVGSFNGQKKIAFLINFLSTSFAKYFSISVFGNKVSRFFQKIVKDAINHRNDSEIVHPNMLQLLIEAQRENLNYKAAKISKVSRTQNKEETEIDEDTITAQVIIHIFGGFDTASTTMAYAIYELAVNPDIQEKLQREVDDAFQKSKGELTYESLISMKYLDMVINETLRKWPPFIMTGRRSVRPFTIDRSSSRQIDLVLETGSLIVCPIKCLQNDSKYYPNPDKFDPERFSEQNKSKIHPYTYFPFGAGPRSCIALRFALLEIKLITAEVVRNFTIVPTSKTKIPLTISKSNLVPLPDDGIWVGFKRRK